MLKPEYVQVNETRKILWDFEIQTARQILVSWPDLEIIYKKREFDIRTDHRVKIKESKRGDKYLDIARELKKVMKYDF